jgi:type III secretion protein U
VTDKTEPPTPRRLRKAREQGDSGASGYAAQAVGFIAAVALARPAIDALCRRVAGDLEAALTRPTRAPFAFDGAQAASEVLALTVPMLAAVALTSAVANAVQTGGVVATGRLAPDAGRLDPFAGLLGLASRARLFAVVRAVVAGLAVGWLGVRGLRERAVDLARTAGRLHYVPAAIADTASTLAWRAALVGLALGVVDLVVTRSAWLEKLKMTKAEVKREHKDAEGDPQLKAARARAHQEVLAQATLANVREASVVVINPTHLACALRYDAEGGDDAPVIVASGEGDLAARIVDAAREAGVPVVRDVPLARALLELEVGDAIPEALYQVVAEILREVWEDDTRGA